MDTISNLIISIKNGYLSKKESVWVPLSNLNKEILKLLIKEKFIKSVKEKNQPGQKYNSLMITLNSDKTDRKFNDVKRISKLSCRIYVKGSEIRLVKSGFGLAVISTNEGVLAGHVAYKKGIGGEHLFNIW